MRNFYRTGATVALLTLLYAFSINMTAATPLTADSLAQRLMYQVWSYPQEKVYVATDRDAYTSGDTVRFRAFLVDAATHARPKQGSGYIYVELLDPFGTNVARMKIKSKNGVFAGTLPIDIDMTEGNYTLCAYTQFMENAGKDYFFRKSLPIFSHLAQKYRFETEIADGQLTARLTERASGRPVRAELILLSLPNQNSPLEEANKRSTYSTKITRKMSEAVVVKLRFDKYDKFISIPGDSKNLSLTFHPEGGYLIAGISNRLAFKALDSKGLSAEISGYIADQEGNKVADIRTEHNGMGAIDFTPAEGQSYHAVTGGLTFPIPDADSNATILSVETPDADNIAVKTAGMKRDGLKLIAQNGGVPSMAIEMTEPSIRIDRNSLGSGIVQLLLLDAEGNTLSSRMIFNHSGYLYNIPADSLPKGDYAVKALRGITPAAPGTSIVADMMLQSELNGHIENPDYYFSDRNDETDRHLDLLLLTQGWKRYDIPSVWKGHFDVPRIPLEIGGEISGQVKSRWKGAPLNNAIVMLISPQLDYAAKAFTDAEGRFSFTGLDWPDGTAFLIQAFNETGGKEHNFSIDNETFPTAEPLAVRTRKPADENLPDESTLTAGTIILDELEVNALPSREESRREMLAAMGVKTITADDIEKMKATSYEEVIWKIPGLRIINGNVVRVASNAYHSRGAVGSPVGFWVDGFRWLPSSANVGGYYPNGTTPMYSGVPVDAIPSTVPVTNNTLSEFSAIYPIHTIKSIEYYSGNASLMLGLSAAKQGGGLVFTTKEGKDLKEVHSDLFIRDFKPLGYQKARDAYRPHFIYDPTSDDTVFNAAWLPAVSDSSEIPSQEGTFVQIEGIADGFMPVFIRK